MLKDNKKIIFISVISSFITVLVVMVLASVFINQQAGAVRGFLASFVDENNGNNGIVFENNGKTNQNGEKKDLTQETEESRLVNIVEKASAAVVSIVITKDVPKIEQYYDDYNPFGDDFFGGFNFRMPQYRENGTEKKEVGGGSGFFVNADGMVVTNRHVIDDDDAEYTIFTNDGEKYEAKILAKDTALDVAILKVEGKDFPYLNFGNSDELKAGQTVIAIGNALAEFRNSVSTGIISGLSRSIVAGDYSGSSELLEGVIQTDAAINPGNSGGPLLDSSGNVIGVNVAMQRGAENIGFAIPSNTVDTIVTSVKEHGEIVRPYIGVRYIQIDKAMQEKNSLSVDYGALVIRGDTIQDLAVMPGSPADKAGLIENDIILEVDGVKLDDSVSLASIIRQKSVGDDVTLKILHKGEEKQVVIKLEKAPSSS